MEADRRRIELVIDLWNNKEMTGGEIALQIGTTRAAVLGLLYRLRQKGLVEYRKDQGEAMAGRPKGPGLKTPRHREPDPPRFPVKVKISDLFSGDPIITSINAITIMRLKQRHCRYPIGRTPAGEHVFCGETRKPGKSMCPEHHARCYYPPKEHRARNPDARPPSQKFTLGKRR